MKKIGRKLPRTINPEEFGASTNPIVCHHGYVVWANPNMRSDAIKIKVVNEIEGTDSYAIMKPVEAMKLVEDICKAMRSVTHEYIARDDREDYYVQDAGGNTQDSASH